MNPKRLVFAEADNVKILKVAQLLYDEGVAFPMLLGDERKIRHIAAANQIDLEGMPVINPYNDEYEEQRKRFGELFFQKRQRRGFNKYEAYKIMRDRNYFGCMMVETGEADAMISGLTKNYPGYDPACATGDRYGGRGQEDRGDVSDADKKRAVVPGGYDGQLQSDGGRVGGYHAAGGAGGPAVQYDPAGGDAELFEFWHQRFAGGPAGCGGAERSSKQKNPELIVDGEMQAAVALNNELIKENYPFSELVDQEVNTLVFPNLAAGNIAYNLLKEVGGADAIGPILLGLKKPVHVLQLGSTVRNIYNVALVAIVDAQIKCKNMPSDEETRKAPWWKRTKRRQITDLIKHN